MDTRLQVDHHTTDDLQIFEGHGDKTILDLFDETVTPDGKLKLKERFYNPFSNIEQVLEVQLAIEHILENLTVWDFPITAQEANGINLYYISKMKPLLFQSGGISVAEGILRRMFNREFREIAVHGTRHMLAYLRKLKQWLHKVNNGELPALLQGYVDAIEKALADELLAPVFQSEKQAGGYQLLLLDRLLRGKQSVRFVLMLNQVYELEALIAVAHAKKKLGFVFPVMKVSEKPVLELEEAWHPFLKTPVPSSFIMGEKGNVVFLTGPNMAGKTTFLRSLGICVYLAHLGFPLPVKSAKMTMLNGILSSINTVDSVTLGYSYFYSEVLRVKKAAQFVRDTPRVLLIMDELFKGTNIKDAYDGSLMVIKGLAQNPNCLVVISSHLLELAEDLKPLPTVSFSCFSSTLVDGKPRFDYRIHEGVSSERIGLLILKNEGVDKLLNVQLD